MNRQYNWRYLIAALTLIVLGILVSFWAFPQALQTPAAIVTVIVAVVVGVFGFTANVRETLTEQPTPPTTSPPPPSEAPQTKIVGDVRGPMLSGTFHGPVTISAEPKTNVAKPK